VHRRGRFQQWGRVTALFAVALFMLASAQSLVMRAAPAAPSVICTGAGVVHAHADHSASKDGHRRGCPVCAVAANAPLSGSITSAQQSAAVAPVAYLARAAGGLRDAPVVTARARGPPAFLSTV
jgi:hypothetical protein